MKLKKEGITGNIVAACSRDDPGLGEAQRTSGQTSVGGVVLLNVFPVTPSAHSTSLSSHPVWNLDLGETTASVWRFYRDEDFSVTCKATARLLELPAVRSSQGRPQSDRVWEQSKRCLDPSVQCE